MPFRTIHHTQLLSSMYYLKHIFTEAPSAVLLGSALSSGGSVSELARASCVWHEGGPWQLLTDATPAASPLPKPCRVDPISYLRCPPTGCINSRLFYDKHEIKFPRGRMSVFYFYLVTRSFDVFLVWLPSPKPSCSSAALCIALHCLHLSRQFGSDRNPKWKYFCFSKELHISTSAFSAF